MRLKIRKNEVSRKGVHTIHTFKDEMMCYFLQIFHTRPTYNFPLFASDPPTCSCIFVHVEANGSAWGTFGWQTK